jgi:hypothetical protein
MLICGSCRSVLTDATVHQRALQMPAGCHSSNQAEQTLAGSQDSLRVFYMLMANDIPVASLGTVSCNEPVYHRSCKRNLWCTMNARVRSGAKSSNYNNINHVTVLFPIDYTLVYYGCPLDNLPCC